MDDPFIREHIEDLLRNIRTQVIHIAGLEDRDLRFSFGITNEFTLEMTFAIR